MLKALVAIAAVLVSAAAVYFVVADQMDRRAKAAAAARADRFATCAKAQRDADAYAQGRDTRGMESLAVVRAILEGCARQ